MRVLPLLALLFAASTSVACSVSSNDAEEDLAGQPDESIDGVEAQTVNSVPWRGVGNGIVGKDTGNTIGNNVFIAYAGFNVSLASAERWATALYVSSLRARGVRHLYAVQGPADPGYDGGEIGNSHLAAQLTRVVDHRTQFVLVAGHSSGSFVADELIEQLASGHDPHGVTAGKVVYFALEGGQKNVSNGALHRLRKAYYVSAHDPTTGTFAPNHGAMQSLGNDFPRLGGFLDYDARSAHCWGGAVWCLHVSLVNTKPHSHATGDGLRDYSDFAGRPVNHFWIDAKANEAGLRP